MIHNVKRKSGGEVDLYGGGPIQKREAKTQPPPEATKPGNTHGMKNTDPALYAHVYSENYGWEREEPVWILAIGRDVPGNPSHGAAQRVGMFNTLANAVLAATERGVTPERVEVGE